MTRFVDTHALAQIVSSKGTADFLAGLVEFMRDDFRRWEDFEKSARVANHSDIGVIELMPISNSEEYGFKYVNGHPSNAQKGVSTVMAFGALADMDTGYPKLLTELTITTAFRTAAASVIAAQALARPDSTVMGMIGCGAQSEFQSIAFHTLLGIKEVRVFDIDRAAMLKLQANLQHMPGLKVTLADTAHEAVRGTDIVTTCTADKKWATILTPDMVEPGMHINALGGDCPGKTELHADVLKAARIFVEFEPQTRIEGDIQHLPADHPVTELWEVITEKATGRQTAEDITVFDSVGFAMEDYSALRYVLALAEEQRVGETIDLIPEFDDPKDLFSLIHPSRTDSKRDVA